MKDPSGSGGGDCGGSGGGGGDALNVAPLPLFVTVTARRLLPALRL